MNILQTLQTSCVQQGFTCVRSLGTQIVIREKCKQIRQGFL